jgi:hypothetical protein
VADATGLTSWATVVTVGVLNHADGLSQAPQGNAVERTPA